MSRKGQSITLSISEQDKVELEALALEFGMTWGERPNISRLVEAIARHQLLINANNNWAPERITALKSAMNALTDAGEIEEALLIANLLLERSELSIPLRAEIERFVGSPPKPWRIEINRYINRQQPFHLSYQSATGKFFNFTVLHAKVVPHEERQYLDCWCEETEENLDVDELIHNWSLRLDRITDASVIPITRKWRSNLDELPVEMHLHGRFAFSYYQSKIKAEDEAPTWVSESPPVLQVVRRVTSTYWFIREVLQNSPDIVVVAPNSVRNLIKQKLLTLWDLYGVEGF